MTVNALADPIKELIRQHRSLLKKLEAIRKEEASFLKSGSPERLRQLVSDSVKSFSSEFAVHVYNEESVIFPSYEAAVGRENKHLGETRAAHNDLSTDMKEALRKIGALARALTQKPPAETPRLIEDLGKNVDFLLKRWTYHTQLEEKYLFPDIQQKLDADTLKKLARQMKQSSDSG